MPAILFSIIAYFMTGLNQTVNKFFIFMLTIFMATIFGSAARFLVSASISIFGEYSLSSFLLSFHRGRNSQIHEILFLIVILQVIRFRLCFFHLRIPVVNRFFVYSKSEYIIKSVSASVRPSVYPIIFDRCIRSS